MSEQIDVAVVILVDGPRTLVNRRPEGSYFGGWWEWPGGKRRQEETFEQCARRELFEEMGLEPVELQEFDRRTVSYPGREVRLVFFVSRVKDGSVASPAALEHRWLTPAQVRELKFLEPNLPVLAKLEKALQKR